MPAPTLPTDAVNLKSTAVPPPSAVPATPSKRRILGVQLVILCCILMTLASFAASVLASFAASVLASFAASVLAGREKLTAVTAGLPVATILAFLALSWSVFRGHNKVLGIFMLVSVCLYEAVLIVLSQGHVVNQVFGESVPRWAWWVSVCVILTLHGWFAEVLYEYVVEVRGGGQQGSKEDMGAIV